MCLWQGQGRCVCLGPRPHNTLMVWSDRWLLFTLSVVLLRLCVRFTIYVFRVWLSNCLENAADLGEWGQREREWVGKCVEPKMLMQFIGEIKNSGSGKCKWKLCQRFANAPLLLAMQFARVSQVASVVYALLLRPAPALLGCQLCAQNWCRLSNFHSGFRLQKTRLGGKGAQGGLAGDLLPGH